MPRPSSIDKLPAEIRVEIGRLRGEGHTIDQILSHLADMRSHVAVSRSALGRHIKGFDKIAEKMRNSRVVAEALVRELGDAPESKTARLNIELMHGAVNELFMSHLEGEGGIDKFGKATMQGNPEGLMMLAKALDHLGRASKSNVEFLALAEKRAADKARAETQAQAVETVEAVAKHEGLPAHVVQTIRAGILGVK